MSTVIPENSFYRTDRDDCIFHNDCYYNISVRSYDRIFEESIIFHSKGKRVAHEVDWVFMYFKLQNICMDSKLIHKN